MRSGRDNSTPSYQISFSRYTYVSDKINKQENEWELLNKIKHEKWNSEKITAVFGPPNSILREGKYNKEYWIYLDKNLDIQKWSIGVSSDGKIFAVTFFPNISNRDLFTKENTKNYWGNSCLEKKEQINNKEFIDNIFFWIAMKEEKFISTI